MASGEQLVIRTLWASELILSNLNQNHIDSIISQKISITRRSAGIPYCILGILTAVLPTDKASFDRAFVRLLEIAESKSTDILDESRVHAMNTLRTTFLDAKCAGAVGPYIERGFLIAISMFWSPKYALFSLPSDLVRYRDSPQSMAAGSAATSR